jgi:hypothetical protein
MRRNWTVGQKPTSRSERADRFAVTKHGDCFAASHYGACFAGTEEGD